MRARLAIGLGLAAVAALLLYLLLRDDAPPSEPAAAPEADAPAIEFERTPVVESPHDAAPVEPEVAEPASPPVKQPAPPRPAPAALAQQAEVALERLPEDWTPPREEFGIVAVTVRSRPDRKPLEGVLVWLETEGEYGPWEMPEPRYTEFNGQATFERVPVGPARVWTEPRGGVPRVQVESDEISSVAVNLARQRSVEGFVRADDGSPASGAEIWDRVLAGAHFVERPLARTNDSGEFRLWINDNQDLYLCARGGDALPSNIVHVPSGLEGTTERVELVLGPKGQQLDVFVTGPNEERLEDATVSIRLSHDASPDLPQWAAFSSIGSAPALWSSKSDASGVAKFDGLPRGRLTIEASAAGYVASHFEIRLPHPESPPEAPRDFWQVVTVADARVKVTLLPGVRLEGRAYLPNGLAAAGAVIRYRHLRRFGATTARADEHGYFRLDGVPTTSCTVYARVDEYRAEEQLPAVAPDATRWWAPVLRYDGRR